MNFGEEKQNENVPEVSSHSDTPNFLNDNAVAIYTLLAILMRIRRTMGLEAMLEYIEHYQELIERYNPDFKDAIKEALAMMSLEKMYRDVTSNEKS